MKYYVLHVVDDIEPELEGPYKSFRARDNKAKELRKEDEEQKNGIYGLDISHSGKARVFSYMGGFLNPSMGKK
jgi:hypothetical protein